MFVLGCQELLEEAGKVQAHRDAFKNKDTRTNKVFCKVSILFAYREETPVERCVLLGKHLPAFSMRPKSLTLKGKLWQPIYTVDLHHILWKLLHSQETLKNALLGLLIAYATSNHHENCLEFPSEP